MTTVTTEVPGGLIRWHYLGYVALALVLMVVAIGSNERWFLNFVHVICGVMWTGIDLFMGFIIGPIVRRMPLAARRELLTRLVPQTLFLMPTLAVITGTTGWYLAEDLGFTALPPGNMIGVVRERDITGGADIVNARVRLDSGQVDFTDTGATYSFAGLTPRYTCATASKAGYHPTTRCVNVASGGNPSWNSIALYPDGDFIDAEPGPADARPADARPPAPDALPMVDAAATPDGGGGDDDGGDGPCGCRVARRGHAGLEAPAAGGACLVLLFQAMLRGRGPRRAR